jgi:hypothetical protein
MVAAASIDPERATICDHGRLGEGFDGRLHGRRDRPCPIVGTAA